METVRFFPLRWANRPWACTLKQKIESRRAGASALRWAITAPRFLSQPEIGLRFRLACAGVRPVSSPALAVILVDAHLRRASGREPREPARFSARPTADKGRRNAGPEGSNSRLGGTFSQRTKPIVLGKDGRERRCPMWLPGKERPAPLALAQGEPGLLKRHPSRLRRAPAIYRPGSLAARSRSAGSGWVSIREKDAPCPESSLVARQAHASPFARVFLGAIHKALADEPPAFGSD
jgi:hypothetical protein